MMGSGQSSSSTDNNTHIRNYEMCVRDAYAFFKKKKTIFFPFNYMTFDRKTKCTTVHVAF